MTTWHLHFLRAVLFLGYNEYREFCGKNFALFKNLARVREFQELVESEVGPIPQEIANNMKKVYDVVDDIDIFVGGTAEEPFQGTNGDSFLGPTFTCIIGDQFFKLKNGDRWEKIGQRKGYFHPIIFFLGSFTKMKMG